MQIYHTSHLSKEKGDKLKSLSWRDLIVIGSGESFDAPHLSLNLC